MEPEFVSVKETGRALCLGHTKLYEMIKSGQLRSITIGRKRLVLAASIREIIDSAS